MVDFRKCLLAFAGVALLASLGSSTAYAQGGFTCNANAGTPNIVRSEGVAEEVGDLILNCTGGTFTPAGTPIPLSNVQISLNTNVTSRIVAATGNISEALILIDEPFPAAGTQVPATATPSATQPLAQLACLAVNSTNCRMTSLGSGLGATGSYNGTTDANGPHYNVFQGFQSGNSSITWNGVPIDAPGTAGTRVIRITNIRANACLLGTGVSTFVPVQIFELIGINGSQTLTINNPQQIVAESELGLVSSVALPGALTYAQCNSVNTYLLSPPGTVTTDTGISVSATEGFAAAFKEQNYSQVLSARAGTYSAPGTTPGLQNVPAFSYNTESGFIPSPTIAGAGGNFSDTGGVVGSATQGTEVSFTIAGVGSGVSLFAPSYVYLTGNYGAGSPIGVAVLAGSAVIPPVVFAPTPATNGPTTPVTLSATTGSLVYQIYYADPSVQETLSVPISVAYLSNTANSLPAFGTSTTTVSFAPLSSSPSYGFGLPIPRFCQNEVPTNLFTINACTCNLLFPFVTSAAGFDTGIAIANTSADTLNGVTPQQGAVKLTYYGTTTGGGAAPPAVTSAPIAAGQELVFDMYSGGSGITGTPGFTGYMIAQAAFQYCHGFAFISDLGAQRLAEGYLAIELDLPTLNRTKVPGENEGH